MKPPLQILHLEDEPHDVELVKSTLEAGGLKVNITVTETREQFLKALNRGDVDVILADYSLPSFDGMSALTLATETCAEIPFIFVSGTLGEELAILSMHNGATDYVLKNKLGRLVPAVKRAIEEAKKNTEQLKMQEELFHLAYFDSLTGLPNRTFFNQRVNLALIHAGRNGESIAIMFLDLDRFKTINDSLGHLIGDKLLKQVAKRLTQCLRKGDTVARLGGDEFLLLLPEIRYAEDCAKVARKIIDKLRPPFEIEGHALHVTSSIGIALFPGDGQEATTLLKNADTAMYRAKESGRNNYQFYTSEMNAKAFELLLLENRLRGALERREFTLHYQPKIRVSTNEIVGLEALLRWQHPELGIVAPTDFIPLAEETGLITSISEWVIMDACARTKIRQESGLPALSVALNVSAVHFRNHSFTSVIEKILTEVGLEPTYLELELTESAAMQNIDTTIRTLAELKEMGIGLSIDDFGTGYSSLSNLKKFPIDALKIDRSLVNDITTDPDNAAIAKAIIAVAHSLKLRVIAEGVETEEQLNYLRENECDELQGYLYSRPVSHESICQMLQNGCSLSAVASGVASGDGNGFEHQASPKRSTAKRVAPGN